MKKLLALMLAAALALSLAACGGDSGAGDTNTPGTGNGDTTGTDAPSGGGGDSTSDENTEPEYLQIGDTFKDEHVEITLTDFEFGAYLDNSTGPVGQINMDYLLPIDVYKSNNPYNAEFGNTMISVTYEVKYIGKVETNHAPSWTIDYNNGYIFEPEQSVVAGSDGWSTISYVPLKPLEKEAHIIRMYFEVPEEVLTNTDAQLLLNYSDRLIYQIR